MTNCDPRPEFDAAALREADRQLAFIADVSDELEGDVRPWIITARRCVAHCRQQEPHVDEEGES